MTMTSTTIRRVYRQDLLHPPRVQASTSPIFLLSPRADCVFADTRAFLLFGPRDCCDADLFNGSLRDLEIVEPPNETK